MEARDSKSYASTITALRAASQRKILLVNIIFKEGLVIFVKNPGKFWVIWQHF